MASSQQQQTTFHPQRVAAPGERIHAQPWSFVAMALAAGVAAGLLLRFKMARRALRAYLLMRRFF